MLSLHHYRLADFAAHAAPATAWRSLGTAVATAATPRALINEPVLGCYDGLFVRLPVGRSSEKFGSKYTAVYAAHPA